MSTFEVVKKTVINGREFERVRRVEDGYEAIRLRYDNSAGQTSRLCPTVWLDDLPDFLRAALELAAVKVE